MPPDRVAPPFRLLALPLAAAALTIACAAPAPLAEPEPPEPMPAVAEPAPLPETPAPPPAAPPAPAVAAEPPAVALLAYADQVRALNGAAATQELARLSGLAPSPVNLLQMALVLLQTRGPGDIGRAAQLLQRVQSEDSREARALHPLARLLAAHLAEQRRVEEQSERNAQQLRDAQRRADQLQDRLDALRAIERARPNRPAAP